MNAFGVGVEIIRNLVGWLTMLVVVMVLSVVVSLVWWWLKTLVSGSIRRIRMVPGWTPAVISQEMKVSDTTKIPILFSHFLDPHLVDKKVRVNFSHVIACGCEYHGGSMEELRRYLTDHMKKGQRPQLLDTLDGIIDWNPHIIPERMYITINDCIQLLNSLVENYELLDELGKASISVNFIFKLKRIKNIDYSLRVIQLLNFVHGHPHEEDIKDVLLSDSPRRMGKGVIAYQLIGPKSVALERSSMVTFPREAKYVSQPERNTLRVQYDGFECAFKYLLANADGEQESLASL